MTMLVNQYKRQQYWQAHTATVLGMIGKMLGGESWKLQSYVEIAYPDSIQTDNRGAAQIKEDIIKRLTA